MEKATFKLIHIGLIYTAEGTKPLFLRQKSPHEFCWFIIKNGQEMETPIVAPNIEEAMRLAFLQWKHDYFRPLNCGFRYTLPERDEHGLNALFHQMAASYASINGVYYDEELGNNCFVQNASSAARQMWLTLKNERL